jgi:hypothetical protein
MVRELGDEFDELGNIAGRHSIFFVEQGAYHHLRITLRENPSLFPAMDNCRRLDIIPGLDESVNGLAYGELIV